MELSIYFAQSIHSLETFEKRSLLINPGVRLKFYRLAPRRSRPLGRAEGSFKKMYNFLTGKPALRVESFNPRNTQSIPMVKIFAFLGLE